MATATATVLRVSQVRPFKSEDILQVADLHRRVFRLADRTTPELLESYRAYFTQVFLSNALLGEASESLVYETEDGVIAGFLGVLPRRMDFNGETIQARVTSQFVVDRNFRGHSGGYGGLKLLSTVFAGPQDITIADESNPDSRLVWEGLGGNVSHLYSMRWIYPLRPCQFALWVARQKHYLPAFASSAATPLARMLDALVRRILNVPSPSPTVVQASDLDCQTLFACLSSAGRKQTLRPLYDDGSLSWLLERAGQMQQHGRLQSVLVKTARQETAGWYLYYANPRGMSEVVQLYATPRFSDLVLDHLFRHAWERGVTALVGRMEANMMQAFSNRHCIFHCGPQWVLVHSRRPELLQAFNTGNSGFSRLDGEWCLRFR